MNHVVIANVERSTELNVKANRQVEHSTTSDLLHVELFRSVVLAFVANIPCKFIGLEIHVEFAEEGEEVEHVEFKSGTCKREGQVSLVHGHAVTTVDVNEERHDVGLSEVERQSCTDGKHRLSRTIRISKARFLLEVFRFANPKTLLGILRGLERISEESSEVDRHVSRDRSTSLQACRHVTDVTNIRTSERIAIALTTINFRRFASGIAVELVVVDRQRHTDVEVVQKTDSETNISTDAIILGNICSLLQPRSIIIKQNMAVTGFRFILEHAIAKSIVAQSRKHKLGMTERLGRLCLVDTDEARLVNRIGMTSEGG